MNINLKLSFTDEQRNLLKRLITGKDVKALATRKEIAELVDDLLAGYMANNATQSAPQGEQPDSFCSDDCCVQNRLLLNRVDVLQKRVDSMINEK